MQRGASTRVRTTPSGAAARHFSTTGKRKRKQQRQ